MYEKKGELNEDWTSEEEEERIRIKNRTETIAGPIRTGSTQNRHFNSKVFRDKTERNFRKEILENSIFKSDSPFLFNYFD